MTADRKPEDLDFGDDVWVYCDQHLRPHLTGWCTVSKTHKTPLEAKTYSEAYYECRQRGFTLYSHNEDQQSNDR